METDSVKEPKFLLYMLLNVHYFVSDCLGKSLIKFFFMEMKFSLKFMAF